jgi:hypothetical protein
MFQLDNAQRRKKVPDPKKSDINEFRNFEHCFFLSYLKLP